MDTGAMTGRYSTSLLFFLYCALLTTLIRQSAASGDCLLSFPKLDLNHTYNDCTSVPTPAQPLGSTLSWTWSKKTGILSATFVHQPQSTNGWVAWGINSANKPQMVPASVLACYPNSSSGTPVVKQYLMTSISGPGITPDSGDLKVVSSSCSIDSTTSPQTYYLSFQLNLGNQTSFSQIYGGGPGVDSRTNRLQGHDMSTCVGASIDISNAVTGSGVVVASLHTDFKNTHGALNVVGWGIFLPLGAMVARYGKFQDPLWFYTHMVLQLSGYIIGTIGFGYGIKLHNWSSSHSKDSDIHYTMGIIVFALATIQILSVSIKPAKKSPQRIYWSLCHWTGGFAVIVLSITNNLLGFHLLQRYGSWRLVYIIVIACLAGLSVVLEIVCWVRFVNLRGTTAYEKDALKPTTEMQTPRRSDLNGDYVEE